jgi:tetratricopeptide (TPR) repeat protein
VEESMGKTHKKIVMAGVCCLMISMLTGCGNDTTKITEGMQLVETLDYQGALTAFDEAEAQKENSRLIARGRGIASMGLTEYDQAVQYFTEALELSDGWVQNVDYDMNYYLAAAYRKNGQPAEAKKVYDAILGLKPEEKDAYFLRGSAELELGDYESAKADFDKAISMDPKNYDRLIEIYEALADYGYREVGQEYLQNVLNTDKKLIPMTAVVFIITWEIIRKPTWHWKKPRVRVEWTAICTWGKLMLPPEIIIMPPVCTAITCPSRDRMRRSIINWDYASWRKRTTRRRWKHFRQENRSKGTA